MTLEEFAKSIQELKKKTEDKTLVLALFVPANKMLANIKNRIVRRGENTSGSKIGNYSTKPMYATREQFDKRSAFKPGIKASVSSYRSTNLKVTVKKDGSLKAKKGKTNYETIKKEKMKTMYLAEGYKELRGIQGKETAFVNLEYRGNLMLSYQQMQSGDTIIQGLISEKEQKKREGLEKRFGSKILSPQESEIEQLKQDMKKTGHDIILKIMKIGV